MDGETNGKPYEQMDDLGGKPTIFGNIHMCIYIYNLPTWPCWVWPFGRWLFTLRRAGFAPRQPGWKLESFNKMFNKMF